MANAHAVKQLFAESEGSIIAAVTPTNALHGATDDFLMPLIGGVLDLFAAE